MKTVWKDITVTWDDRSLNIRNSRFYRSFDLSAGILRTREMGTADGTVFAVENRKCCDLECYGTRLELDQLKCTIDQLNCQIIGHDPFEAPHLLVTVRIFNPYSRTRLTREFRLFPEQPFYSIRNGVEAIAHPNYYWLNRRTLNEEYTDLFKDLRDINEPLMDVIHPAENFRITRTVEFFGHTDVHNHPVVEHPYEEGNRCLTGNLLYCENPQEQGFLILQEAPPSSERREREDYDFRISDKGDVHSLCWGIMPEDLGTGKMLYSYRNMIALYRTPEERDRILKDYQRLRTAASSPRRAVVANAWGCGSFLDHLSEEFLTEEITAAAECGAEYYQIDDGWQTGINLGYITLQNTCCPLRDFWSISPKIIRSGDFSALAETAARSGIRLALWLAPSTNIAYRDHTEFKNMILDFHRRYGFDLFKLDNASFPTYAAEQNFTELLRQTRLESEKNIYFNLDVTAGQRGGYFLLGEYGSVFLENRFACRPEGKQYHPELTLRNFWHLTKYVRAQNLQIEVPFPGDIEADFYQEAGLTQPDCYSWEYWMAVAFFASPLLWFAPSMVPPKQRPRIRAMMELHRKYRDRIFAGEIDPIGQEPDGKALTGFVSRSPQGDGRFAILLREYGADQDSLRLPGKWQLLTGNGQADGDLLTIPRKASFAVFIRSDSDQ